jgi:ABC-type glycerol-3-phosphate transport system permease component
MPELLKMGIMYFLLFTVTMILLFPIYMMLSISLKPESMLLQIPPVWLYWPVSYHYFNVLNTTPFARWLLNSLVVSVGVAAVTVVMGLFGAYSLTRFEYVGKDVIATSILFVYLFPPVLLAIPLYVFISRLHLANTLLGLGIAYLSFTIPFCLWFLRGYFTTLPKDIEEQALVDGCGRVESLIRVALPVALPGLAAAFLFAFTAAYTEYLYALIILNNPNIITLTVGLSQYSFGAVVGGGNASWGDVMAASFMAGVPAMIIFLILQKYLVTGLAAGAVKA